MKKIISCPITEVTLVILILVLALFIASCAPSPESRAAASATVMRAQQVGTEAAVSLNESARGTQTAVAVLASGAQTAQALDFSATRCRDQWRRDCRVTRHDEESSRMVSSRKGRTTHARTARGVEQDAEPRAMGWRERTSVLNALERDGWVERDRQSGNGRKLSTKVLVAIEKWNG